MARVHARNPSESVFEQVADELYALAPSDFIAARDAAVEQARRAGDRPLAQRLHALRRPTTAAHALNLLVRAHPEYVGQLRGLGHGLLEAQKNLEGPKLREFAAQRNALVTALTGEARGVAAAAGQPVGDQAVAELDQTLRAVLADDQAADQLANGRLTHALTPGGTLPDSPTIAAIRATPTAPARRPATGQATEAERERQRRLTEAERAVRVQEAQRRAAEADLQRSRELVQRTAEQRRVTLERLDVAMQSLAQAEDAAAAAERDEEAAQDAVAAAERHAEQAGRALKEAQATLRSLRNVPTTATDG